eukprot:1136428-Pelagomonas_calceolata.AAC.5
MGTESALDVLLKADRWARYTQTCRGMARHTVGSQQRHFFDSLPIQCLGLGGLRPLAVDWSPD